MPQEGPANARFIIFAVASHRYDAMLIVPPSLRPSYRVGRVMHRIEPPRLAEFKCPACEQRFLVPLCRAYREQRCHACDEPFLVLPVPDVGIEPIRKAIRRGWRSTAGNGVTPSRNRPRRSTATLMACLSVVLVASAVQLLRHHIVIE